jgi:thioredoxin-like negative regulator of GroEL
LLRLPTSPALFQKYGVLTIARHRAAHRHAETTVSYKVDVDKFPTAKENLKVETLPAVIVFRDGKELKRVEGINKDNAKDIASVLV